MIEEKTKKELKERYNPEGSNRRKAQLRMLEMLIFFDDFCGKNNIRYWLDGGTLLGALRHQGFIPWDDDTDVCMPYEDFQRFVNLFGNKQIGDYVLQNHNTDSGYYRYWSVVRDLKSEYEHTDDLYTEKTIKYKGLQIDVFPVITEYNKITYTIGKYIKRFVDYCWKREARFKHQYFTSFFFFLGNRLFFPLFHQIVKRKHEDVVMDYGVGFWKEKRNHKDFFPLNKILFEGHEFWAPKESLSYCMKLYGESCMELPPEEIRYNHQSNVLFFSD